MKKTKTLKLNRLSVVTLTTRALIEVRGGFQTEGGSGSGSAPQPSIAYSNCFSCTTSQGGASASYGRAC